MSEQQTGAMDDHGHDKVFVATFMGVLAVLVGIAIVIAIVANSIDPDEGLSDEARAKIADRVAPVGGVYTDASQVPAAPVKAEAVARSTDEIVNGVCGGCHNTGVMDAPKTGDASAWSERKSAAGGIDGLVAAAIGGKGAMPARGGDASLTDEQIRAAVERMLAN